MRFCVMYDAHGNPKSFHADTRRGAKTKASRNGYSMVWVKRNAAFAPPLDSVDDEFFERVTTRSWRRVAREDFWTLVNGVREAAGFKPVPASHPEPGSATSTTG